MSSYLIESPREFSISLLCCLVSLLFSLLPSGQSWLYCLKPDFFVLMLAFLSRKHPVSISFILLIIVGLLFDVLTSNVFLGQTSLALVICAVIALRFYKKRPFFSNWQEGVFVAFLTLQNGLIISVFNLVSLSELNYRLLVGPVISNVVLWLIWLSFI